MTQFPRTIRLRPLLVLVGITAFGTVACGDDDDGATTTTIDAAAFVAAGNALCDEVGAEIDAVFPDFGGEPTIEQVMQLGADLGPVLEGFRRDVAALVPPAGLAAAHKTLIESLDESISILAAMAANEEGAQAALDAGGPPLDEPSNAAHAIFPGCPPGDA